MSMAAWYSRNAAAFTRPSPLLRVELTMENRNFRPVSNRCDTLTPLRLLGGKVTTPYPHPSALRCSKISSQVCNSKSEICSISSRVRSWGLRKGRHPHLQNHLPPLFSPHQTNFQKPPEDNRVAPTARGHGGYLPPDPIKTPSAIL